MWKPPQRIKYQATHGRIPCKEEISNSQLFSEITLRGLELEQRSWVPAMVPWRASEDGYVTDDVLDWYERFALGQPGAIVVEATGIRDISSGPLLRIGDDRFIPGLKQLVEVVSKASKGHTRLLIQLIDFLTVRRRPDPEKYIREYLEITDNHRERLPDYKNSEEAIRDHLLQLPEQQLGQVLTVSELRALTYGYREEVNDTHLPHIAELPQRLPGLFADAALRAKQAGFDGIELHYAHAYTMASFLSATNTRADTYGGSKENRVRLPLEVYKRVREQVGQGFCVGCRILSDEIIHGGSSKEDVNYFAVELARAGIDFISFSRGGKFDDARQPQVGWAVYPYTGQSGYECMPAYLSDEVGPFGRNIEPVASFRQAIRKAGYATPVIVAGGIHNFEQAEQILQQGKADIIASARQTLADPDWFLKLKQGKGEQIRLCEYTNYCEGLDQKHKQVSCQLWDRLGRDEPGVKLSKCGKRRMTAPEWKQ